MIEVDDIKKHLKLTLSDKRYIHSLNTADTAFELAGIFDENPTKAYISGLVHDCTREKELSEQQSMLKALDIEVDTITYSISELLHAYSAEYLMRHKFNIDDGAIISAVRFHTTGKVDMSLLEKIIFLSDVIEPSRSFPGVEYIRQLSRHNLDEALVAAFDSSIRFLIGKRALVHPNTVHARNYILTALLK